MYNLLIAIYILVCIGLLFLVLIQRGRGGGLVESFSSAESLFGTKTNKYLVRFTAILAALFFVFTVIIAIISKQSTKSLIELQKTSDFLKKKKTETEKEQQTLPEGDVAKGLKESEQIQKIKIKKNQNDSQELSGMVIPKTKEPKTNVSDKEADHPPLLPAQ